VRCAERGLGRPIFAPDLPMSLGRLGFAALAAFLRATGHASLARHAAGTLAMLTRDNPFDSSRARSELGWSPHIGPEVGLADAFRDWASGSRRASSP